MLSLGVNCIVSPGEGSELLKKPVRVLAIKDEFVLVIELGTSPTKPWRVGSSLLIEEINNGAAVINLKWYLCTCFEVTTRSVRMKKTAEIGTGSWYVVWWRIMAPSIS